jgi:hypothetical protein
MADSILRPHNGLRTWNQRIQQALDLPPEEARRRAGAARPGGSGGPGGPAPGVHLTSCPLSAVGCQSTRIQPAAPVAERCHGCSRAVTGQRRRLHRLLPDLRPG